MTQQFLKLNINFFNDNRNIYKNEEKIESLKNHIFPNK